MTIGLYDIDLYHGRYFALSLPLMKIYNYLFKKNHQVIMMRKNEDTGRYNKIFYFKSLPWTNIPNNLKLNLEKGQMVGYGFYKNSGLTNSDIIETPPSFTPYDLVDNNIKNKTLYKKIKKHSIIDWREKDFTDDKPGNIIFVNDIDYSLEEDWVNLFTYYKDRRISFVYPFFCQNFTQFNEFLNSTKKGLVSSSIVVPPSDDIEKLLNCFNDKNIWADSYNFNDENLFKMIFASKVLDVKIKFISFKEKKGFRADLIRWNNQPKEISFQSFLQNKFKETDYYKFKYAHLLKQKPNFLEQKDLISLNII